MMKSPSLIIFIIIIIVAISSIFVVSSLDPYRNAVNYSVNDKFIITNPITVPSGYYIEDDTKSFNKYYRVDGDMYNYMQIGKNYSCKIPPITIESITDINPHHSSKMMCKEI
jgi:hypothetical protein